MVFDESDDFIVTSESYGNKDLPWYVVAVIWSISTVSYDKSLPSTNWNPGKCNDRFHVNRNSQLY